MKTSIIYIFLSISFFLFSASIAAAQLPAQQRMSFGILGGVNFQNLNGKDMAGNKLENTLIPGFHGGVNVQIPVAPEFYFQPGLLFSTKGAKVSSEPVTTTYKLSYIELPLNVVYKGMLGNGYFLLGFGPYLGYAIGGKATYEGGSAEVKRDIEFKNVVELTDPLTTPYFRGMDAGGNIFFGYELAAGLFFHVNAQLGMIKINPEYKILPDDQSVVKNTGFGLSLGYRL
jgi:hypothetical protein